MSIKRYDTWLPYRGIETTQAEWYQSHSLRLPCSRLNRPLYAAALACKLPNMRRYRKGGAL